MMLCVCMCGCVCACGGVGGDVLSSFEHSKAPAGAEVDFARARDRSVGPPFLAEKLSTQAVFAPAKARTGSEPGKSQQNTSEMEINLLITN